MFGVSKTRVKAKVKKRERENVTVGRESRESLGRSCQPAASSALNVSSPTLLLLLVLHDLRTILSLFSCIFFALFLFQMSSPLARQHRSFGWIHRSWLISFSKYFIFIVAYVQSEMKRGSFLSGRWSVRMEILEANHESDVGSGGVGTTQHTVILWWWRPKALRISRISSSRSHHQGDLNDWVCHVFVLTFSLGVQSRPRF